MKHIFLAMAITLCYLFLTTIVRAEHVAGTSAKIAYNISPENTEEQFFIKKLAIKRVLERYDSPMANSAESFIKACRENELNCFLLPSITGLESTFGKFIHPQSYNPFGWGRGYIMFKTWDDSISTVASGLKNHYVDRGARTISQIAPIYSESPTWASRVEFFVNQFDREEEKIKLLLDKKQVEL